MARRKLNPYPPGQLGHEGFSEDVMCRASNLVWFAREYEREYAWRATMACGAYQATSTAVHLIDAAAEHARANTAWLLAVVTLLADLDPIATGDDT